MKKLTAILALVLCLILVVFAFASCDKKNKKTGTTAAPTTAAPASAAPSSDDATTAPEPTQEPHVCTPGELEVDQPATCIAKGTMARFCTECGQIIEGSVVETDIDPNAHQINEWITIEPTLLNPNGSETGTCTLCDATIVHELVFKPYVFLSTWDAAARTEFNTENKVDWLNNKDLPTGIYIKKQINKVKDEDTHYYPTDVEPLGNDLLVEVSYLWNSTMTSGGGYGGEPLTFANGDGYDVFHVAAKLDAKDNRKIDDVLCQYTYVYPTQAEIDANSTLKKPSLGDYGWHRLGFRVHQEAEIVTGEVKYTYVASAYVDGVKVLAFELSDWVVRYFKSTVTGLLFTAEINAEDDTKLDYYDIGSNPKSGYNNSYGMFIVEEFFNSTESTAYVVLGDLSVTCGQEFVQKVEPNANPDDATFTLNDNGTPDDTTDDITCPAKIWYKAVIN